MTSVPVEALSRISINRVALQVNSDFYNLQPAIAKGKFCGKPDVAPFLPLAEAHEGLGNPPPINSHAGVLRDELNKQVPQAAEDAVALDQASLELVVAQKVRAGIASAKLKSQDAPPAGQGIVSAIQYCEFKYFKP